jgi:NADH:ubiquinone oxidoreductase subunit 6 (subunit J)
MMLNVKTSKSVLVDYSSWEFYWTLLLVPKFSYLIKLTIEDYLTFTKPQNIFVNLEIDSADLYTNDIDIFSQLLYTHYFFVFILVSIVLLVAMIGALIITTNKNLIK